MGAIRDLIRRYPVAAIAVVVAAAFGGWTIYQARQAQQPAHVLPPPTSIATLPAAPPGAAPVTPTGPARQAGVTAPVTPTSPSGAAAPGPGGTSPSTGGVTAPGLTAPGGATPTETSGEGRANPFEPLTGPPGSSPAPGGAPLPPVPSLPPAGSGGPGVAPAPVVPAAPVYRVVGFLWGDTAIAILEDGQDSYIVGPGDTVKPGVRVVAIDVRRELVRLDRDGTAVELMLPGRRSP